MEAYIDNLNWKSFFWIFFQNKFKKFYYLEPTRIPLLLKNLLKVRKIKIEEIEFSLRSLKTNKGKFVYLESFEKNVEFSFKLSEKIISNSFLLNKLNQKYGNNTIKLYFSKFLQTNLTYWISRVYTAKSLVNSKNFTFFIKSPYFIEKTYISELFPEINMIFYNSFINQRFSFLIEVVKGIYTSFLHNLSNLSSLNSIEFNYQKNIPSLLSIQEESLRLNQSLRNQFHWVDLENSKREYPIHVITLNKKTSKVIENVKLFLLKKIYVHKTGLFAYSRKKFKRNTNILDIKKWKSKLYSEILKKGFDINNYYLAKTIFLLDRSIDIASACLLLNVKTYLIKETYLHYSDAIQLLSKGIGVKTISYQYSNLGLRSPLMMSSSDIFLTFSRAYNPIFVYNSIGPKRIIPIGYSKKGIEKKLNTRISKLKNLIKDLNVDFVITFFDEANAKSKKWAMIHEDDYKENIKLLSKKVINDNKIAIIVKTQFNQNTIFKKFMDDSTIIQAIKTGRLIEVFAGDKRNDVYPFEVASCADICINHKLGATAALESVSINKRCLLIDPYNYNTIHDKIYNKKNIIYSSLKDAMNAIDHFRIDNNSAINNDLGDWSEIKSYFLEETDPNGVDAINKKVEESLSIS